MSIKSFFLPDSALQGEEIPSFVLWKDMEYDKIEVFISNCCEVKEIHNVDDKNSSILDNKIIISSVEVEGYLGVIFESERTDELLIESEIKYLFSKDDVVVKELTSKIVLFKPELIVRYVPDTISIIDEQIREEEKIILENVGEGTCQIRFMATEDSEVKVTQPKRLVEFLSGFAKTFEEEIKKIRDKYEFEDYIVEDLKYLVNTVFDPSEEKTLKEFKIRMERLDNAFEYDEELFGEIIKIYVYSLFKNLSMITVLEQFLDYLRSIEKNRVRLLNALDSIHVSQGSNMMELKVHYTDLLNSTIKPISFKKIIISSDKDCDVSIFNLFRWMGEENT